MSFLEYQERVKQSYHPRHPFVAVHDMAIAVGASFLILATEEALERPKAKSIPYGQDSWILGLSKNMLLNKSWLGWRDLKSG